MLFSIYKKISSYFICNCLIFKRAASEARTRDPQLGKLMLYQLSYYRVGWCKSIQIFYFLLPLAQKKLE